MIDRLGTLVGFLIGLSFILFGITWPDHLSNYYVYQITQFERSVETARQSGATRQQVQQIQTQEEDFKNSWAAGITRYLDLKSAGIVLGGSFAAVLIAFPFRRAIATLWYFLLVFARERREEEFEAVYDAMLVFADYRYRNEIIPDDRIAAVPIYFLRDAMDNFVQVDWVTEEMAQEIINSEIDNFDWQQEQEIAVMEYMGRAAPAFGMLGTVVGLILLMGRAAGENAKITDILGGMSVGLITTLYGVLLAQLIFLPVAAKLERNKDSYIRLYEMIREGVLYLQRRERPDVIEQDLQIYLSKKRRSRIREDRRAAMARGELGI